MIGLHLEDPTVLRRTLEDLQRGIIKIHTPVTPVLDLAVGADLPTTVDKINEIIKSVNALGAILNTATTTSLS